MLYVVYCMLDVSHAAIMSVRMFSFLSHCPLEKVLYNMQVVRAAGISPILQRSAQHNYDNEAHNADALDSNAVGDALECLLQVVTASSEGKAIAVQSECLQAAAEALKVDLAQSTAAWRCDVVSAHLPCTMHYPVLLYKLVKCEMQLAPTEICCVVWVQHVMWCYAGWQMQWSAMGPVGSTANCQPS